ncbi:P-loop NTPase family protein [Actinacidiphila paucisporea]|uniref:Orc1-like AAA ATPase domain-containing protein n=1 Tax=Actinacidiphila paucisporea TaxID=310782 RepID=A0A1M7ESG9_9ACTN|nr:ATP-binding protein [Actinacidiphila paucisporea]SHL94528.1 hypothetical protein SAMN05216499_10766 [Actinacidiphila paucisporea]
MAGEQLSLQDGMRRRGRGGFVGCHDELAVFRANLDTDPGDEAHHFLFHVHGPGGVGKTTLLAQFAQAARAGGALTATANEDAMTVPDAMAAIVAEPAEQDRPLRAFDRLHAVHRQRRYEADAQGAAGATSPSALAAASADADAAVPAQWAQALGSAHDGRLRAGTLGRRGRPRRGPARH